MTTLQPTRVPVRPSFPSRPGDSPGWVRADIAVKAVLGALLLFSVTHTDWARFADKAMTARAVAYPVLVGLVPLVWWLARTAAARAGRRLPQYPGLIAFLITLPFVVDVAGNALNLYDTVHWFNTACHLVNWATLCTGLGLALLRRSDVPAWCVAALCVGFGAVTAVLWEIGEYGAFILKTPERLTLYRDTISDLTFGLTGSLLAGLACAAVARRQATVLARSA
jgi:hypothetical protein